MVTQAIIRDLQPIHFIPLSYLLNNIRSHNREMQNTMLNIVGTKCKTLSTANGVLILIRKFFKIQIKSIELFLLYFVSRILVYRRDLPATDSKMFNTIDPLKYGARRELSV